jgi:5-methylcytosine-specific restriction protein A
MISKLILNEERYIIKGSPGNGNWSSTPWIAILDVLITNTPQSGYYPVFLFRDDMSGFYLSLNQGVTEIEAIYKREAKEVLKIKAQDFKAQIGKIPSNFDEDIIKLKNLTTTKSKYPSLYEAGNIISKFYSADKIPSDNQLQNDIKEILNIYELISYNEGLPSTQAEKEDDEEKYKEFEELRKFRFHKRIERNIRLSKKVKETQGYTCKVCKLNFVERYGEIGKGFIEAHHLVPISYLTQQRIQLDARKDFVVLCSNCHSMIHRLEDPSNIELLKSLIR